MLIILLALLISGLQPSLDLNPAHLISTVFSGESTDLQTAEQEEELTTIILVRHAETEEVPGDVELNDAGRERARSLAQMLEHAGITAVYSTPYNRTRQTAESVAGTVGLEVKEYNPRDPQVIRKIVESNRGGTVLVAGHSNTTPGMVNQLLGEGRFQQLSESDYGNIYIVTLGSEDQANVLHLRY